MLAIEELYWKQKAHVKWMKSGDKNTVFPCHCSANGQWLDAENDNGQEAIRFFQQLFMADNMQSPFDLLQLIPKMISLEENENLEQQ